MNCVYCVVVKVCGEEVRCVLTEPNSSSFWQAVSLINNLEHLGEHICQRIHDHLAMINMHLQLMVSQPVDVNHVAALGDGVEVRDTICIAKLLQV